MAASCPVTSKARQTLVFTNPEPPMGSRRPGLKGNIPGPSQESAVTVQVCPHPTLCWAPRWTHGVFSNKTQLIPLGGLLCSKASLFHSTQQSPGRGCHKQSVIHQCLTTEVLPGGQADIESLPPRCQSCPPRHVSRAEFSRESRGGQQDHLAVDPALRLSLYEATVP